jgi:hypothetical protein
MPPERTREQHERPDEFGRAVAKHALEEAKRRNGGSEPREPVELAATVTVSPGSWSVCVDLGLIHVCYHFN